MIFVPYERLTDKQYLERNHKLMDTFGNLRDGYYDFTEEEMVKKIIYLYKNGTILEPTEFSMYIIYSLKVAIFYNLMIKLTSSHKVARQIFLNSWGTPEDSNSAIRRLMQGTENI